MISSSPQQSNLPPFTASLVDDSNSAASKFAQQNAALLVQIRQQNNQMKELREERDQLLDHITNVEEKHATFKAMNEDNSKLGYEVDQLKLALKKKEDELTIELRKKEKQFITIRDENFTLKSENERLKTIKMQFYVAIKDRDTKIENFEASFADLRRRYYEMVQEVETSKSLAVAIKQAAEAGATITHSTNLRRKQQLNQVPAQVQNLPAMGEIQFLSRQHQMKSNEEMLIRQQQTQSAHPQIYQQQHMSTHTYNPVNQPDNDLSAQGAYSNGKLDEDYHHELIRAMDKKELQMLRKKSVIDRQPVNSYDRRTSPRLSIRHTNGSYNKKNKDKAQTEKKIRNARKNVAFGKTNQRIGRASWVVHKDANYFINNSSIESKQLREYNTHGR